MTTLELVLNTLAEATTTEIARADNAQGLAENATAVKKGGMIARSTRTQIEKQTKKTVISRKNNFPTKKPLIS